MKKLAGLIPVLILIAVVVGMKMNTKAKASAEIKSIATQYIASVPRYRVNKPVYDDLFSTQHKEAFNQAYSFGGRYSSSKFDWIKYKAFLLALMEKEAKLKGKDKIASDLKAFSKAENLPGVIFNN
jgi:hypothetical protein